MPALKHLGDLNGAQPVILVDSREQAPLIFTRLESRRATLVTGDYSVDGAQHLFAIERKSVSDLIGCCCGQNRERFERELGRLRGYRFKRLILIGSERDVRAGTGFSRINPDSVFGSLAAWECRFDVPVLWCNTAADAALQVEKWAFYFSRELVATINDLWRASRLPRGMSRSAPDQSGLSMPSPPQAAT